MCNKAKLAAFLNSSEVAFWQYTLYEQAMSNHMQSYKK